MGTEECAAKIKPWTDAASFKKCGVAVTRADFWRQYRVTPPKTIRQIRTACEYAIRRPIHYDPPLPSMTTQNLLRTVRRAVVCLCLALSLATFALPVRADDPPKFAAPEVNDFVKNFSELVDAYVKAVKAKDDTKMKELDAKGKELDGLGNTIEARSSRKRWMRSAST